jgi:hypothetical protein
MCGSILQRWGGGKIWWQAPVVGTSAQIEKRACAARKSALRYHGAGVA